MTAEYLTKLNEGQRQAVEHAGGGPLLVIAGAGSGKTNTLATRVAHLVACGADPSRILLLTFSRRASVEMIRRVEQILAANFGDAARRIADALAFSGTFHAVGGRVLRELAERIGLDPAFTIHDREEFGRPLQSRSARSRAVEDRVPLSSQGNVLGDLLSLR